MRKQSERKELITVYVKLMGSLRANCPQNSSGLIEVSLRKNSTLSEAVRELKIPVDRVKLVLVNHTAALLNQPLKDGDRISLFPPEYPVFADWKGTMIGRGHEDENVEDGETKK